MCSILYPGWMRVMIALMAVGIAFGYIEATVVEYMGVIYEPARQHFHPNSPHEDVFPLLTLDQILAMPHEQQRLLAVEFAREIATIAMLGAVALAVARSAGQWAAAFAIAFGVWDLSFYAALKLLDNWPASLLTWDLLFLVPVPWAAPVLAPVLVSLSMVVAGFYYLRRAWSGTPVRLGGKGSIGIAIGAVLVVLSFVWDYGNLESGGMPRRFPWAIFAAGEAIGLLSFVTAGWKRRDARRAAA